MFTFFPTSLGRLFDLISILQDDPGGHLGRFYAAVRRRLNVSLCSWAASRLLVARSCVSLARCCARVDCMTLLLLLNLRFGTYVKRL